MTGTFLAANVNTAEDHSVHVAEMKYYIIVYMVLALIILIVFIDLWCCVDGKIPENSPFYLHESLEAEERNQKIKADKEAFIKKKRDEERAARRELDL